MVYNIQIRPLAALEIVEAYEWYESQKAGLGIEFLNAFESFQALLQQQPLTYSYYKEPVRQGLIERFPYVVVYEVFDTTVVIYSVFLTHRYPDKKRTY